MRCQNIEFSTFGRHSICDLWGVNQDLLTDASYLAKMVKETSFSCGATVLSIDQKETNNGFSILCLLSESHVSLHANKNGYVALDAYTCGNTIDPEMIIEKLVNLLTPEKFYRRKLVRGTGDIITN